MAVVDWQAHRRHRLAVARDEGQWVGLFNERCEPIMDCPPLLSPMEAPQRRNAPSSFKALFAARIDTHPHYIVDELTAGGATVDTAGRLVRVPNRTRFIVVERPGLRHAYRVSHAVDSGNWHESESLEVHGADLLAELNRHPAWSAPTTVTGSFTTFTRDWAGPENVGVTFTKPRDLQDYKLVTVADGVTLGGGQNNTAESTIRELITRSLQTSWRASAVPGVVEDPPIVVNPAGSGLPSPKVLIRPTDGKLLETVVPDAEAAGVGITARLWLPGDEPVEGLALSGPKIVVRVEQLSEVK